ncbi:MAG: hypothetical protein DCC56_04490 [Anaerolineae bacterium]|nr:MAG: hypothetical protein DCC56_04490 [Anaerolineae bacterium]
MASLLIVYGAKSHPLRATTEDHLYCFRRYSGHQCYYFNMLRLGKPWYRKPPQFIRRQRFDLIVFYLDLLNIQWPPYTLDALVEQAEYFRDVKSVKVALAQDEFYNTDLLDRFVREFGMDHVFSLAPESEWTKIYPRADLAKVRFHRVLPGYLDERRLREITRQADAVKNRPIAIGYRAVKSQNMHWLGRHGFMKLEIADRFESSARQYGLSVDISTRAEDVLLGDDWYRFLLQSKYTIAVEGGASILDRDGSVRQKTEAYLAERPHADFDEVERACFPGRDGELNYMAISPKHLESCATRTCQILVEGEYNGILTPGVHYIELKRDFSNIGQVMEDVRTDRLRGTITQRAYTDIVESGAYTYRAFVRWALGLTLPTATSDPSHDSKSDLSYVFGRLFETAQWIELSILSTALRFIRKVLPPSVETFLRKMVA